MSATTTRRPAKGLDELDDADKAAMAEMRAADAVTAPADDDAPGGNMPALETAPEAPPEAPAAEEAPEPPEAPDGEDAPAAADKPRRDTKVPLAALHEEREKRRALEKKIQDEALKAAKTEERLALLAAAVTEATKPPPAAPAAPEPIPEFDADPAGHIMGRFNAQQKQIEAVLAALGQQGQSFQQMEQQRQQAAAVGELQRWGQQHEAAEMASNPAYGDASKHLVAARHAELEALGYSDPNQRQQIIANEALQLASMARQQNGNFAHQVLALAKARGWAPPAVAQPAAAAAAADPVVPEPAAPSREAAQERGREMALTLGTGGGAPRGALTADNLARMPDADFEAVLAKAKRDPAAMRALFGA